MKKSRKYYPYIAFMIFILCLSLIIPYKSKKSHKVAFPIAEKGYIDLREWDFDKDGIVPLRGEWEFYYNEMITSSDSEFKSDIAANMIIVPGLWNSFEKNGKNIGPFGYGTYRLIVDFGDNIRAYGLKIPDFPCAYRLFANNRLVCENGKTGVAGRGYVPQRKSEIATIEVNSPRVELIVQIANYSHIKGGMWGPILVGTSEQIFSKRGLSIAAVIFLFSSALITGLYNLALYSMRKDDKSAMHLGLFCMVVAMRTVLTGDILVTTIFPALNFQMHAKLEYITLPLIVLSFSTFIHYLYQEGFHKFVFNIIRVVCLIYVAVIIMFPLRIFAFFLFFFHLFSILCFASFLGVLLKAYRKGQEGSGISLAGTGVLMMTIINDIAYANRLHTIYHLDNTLPIGLFIFMACQAFVLLSKLSRELDTAKSMTQQLDRKISEKTRELEEANKMLRFIAGKDSLTLLNNRQEFVNCINAENKKYSRQLNRKKIKYCIIYLDLDNFKYFNDSFGHFVGDLVLKEFADLIKKVIRTGDNAFRIGGDEFIILLPNTDISGAISVSNRIIKTLIERNSFIPEIEQLLCREVDIKEEDKITCSIGISYYTSGMEFDLEYLMNLADKALLQAKRKGKNQVSVNVGGIL